MYVYNYKFTHRKKQQHIHLLNMSTEMYDETTKGNGACDLCPTVNAYLTEGKKGLPEITTCVRLDVIFQLLFEFYCSKTKCEKI